MHYGVLKDNGLNLSMLTMVTNQTVSPYGALMFDKVSGNVCILSRLFNN